MGITPESRLGALLVLTGPTASGKSETRERLLSKYPNLRPLVTTTSRPPRLEAKTDGKPEVDGVDYHFVTPVTFEGMVERGEFVEYVSYPGGLYGTTKQELEQVLNGKSLVSTMEISGAATLPEHLKRAYDPETAQRIIDRTMCIFFTPESDETQRKWYEGRRHGIGDLETRRVQDKILTEQFGEKFPFKVTNRDGQIEETIAEVERLVTDRFHTPIMELFG